MCYHIYTYVKGLFCLHITVMCRQTLDPQGHREAEDAEAYRTSMNALQLMCSAVLL